VERVERGVRVWRKGWGWGEKRVQKQGFAGFGGLDFRGLKVRVLGGFERVAKKDKGAGFDYRNRVSGTDRGGTGGGGCQKSGS